MHCRQHPHTMHTRQEVGNYRIPHHCAHLSRKTDDHVYLAIPKYVDATYYTLSYKYCNVLWDTNGRLRRLVSIISPIPYKPRCISRPLPLAKKFSTTGAMYYIRENKAAAPSVHRSGLHDVIIAQPKRHSFVATCVGGPLTAILASVHVLRRQPSFANARIFTRFNLPTVLVVCHTLVPRQQAPGGKRERTEKKNSLPRTI